VKRKKKKVKMGNPYMWPYTQQERKEARERLAELDAQRRNHD